MLAVLGTSKAKEDVADAVLKMEEASQAILKDTMVKYMTSEEDRKRLAGEREMIEYLQQQLKAKENERINAMEYLSKLEIENNNISSKLTALQKENRNLMSENEELRKELIKNIKTPNPLINIQKDREEELNNEICSLNAKLAEAEKDFEMRLKKLEAEKLKLQDELFIANQKALKLSSVENSLNQYKDRLEKLQETLEGNKSIEKKVEIYEVKLEEMEKEKDNILIEYQKLQSQYYTEKTEHKLLIETNKKNLERLKRMEEDMAVLEDKNKYWEQKTKELEEDRVFLKEENETLKDSNSDKVTTHKEDPEQRNRIGQLEAQVALLAKNDTGLLMKRIEELEEKLLKATIQQNERKEKLELLDKENKQLKEEYNKALEKLKSFGDDKGKNSELYGEIVKLKEERDSLLKLASNAKEIACRFESMKKSYVKAASDNKVMKRKIEEITNHLAEFEKKAKDQINVNIEQEKNVSRLNEKIASLEEEKLAYEKLIKDLSQKANIVTYHQ